MEPPVNLPVESGPIPTTPAIEVEPVAIAEPVAEETPIVSAPTKEIMPDIPIEAPAGEAFFSQAPEPEQVLVVAEPPPPPEPPQVAVPEIVAVAEAVQPTPPVEAPLQPIEPPTNPPVEPQVQPDSTVPQITNINKSLWQTIREHYLPHIILYVVVSAFVIYMLPNQFTVFIVIMVGLFAYSRIFAEIKGEFTEQFGKSIGFEYQKHGDMVTVNGRLFRTGANQSIYDVLIGTYLDLPMRIFTFKFTVQEGRSAHTYSYTVFEAALKGTVPDISLYSNSQYSFVVNMFSGDETVELEGDFNKFFKLRVPKGYEQEAFQIFTPDVMADLIDKGKSLSFEFNGNELYMYATRVLTTREDMQSMFGLTEFLDALFRKNTERMKTEQPAVS